MSSSYFIETLARNGDVLHRHQVQALPIRLGRGYDNDFILDDHFAAPRHAIIEADENGKLVLRDLGSRNGVIHRGKRKSSLELTGNTVVRIGHTILRVRGADFDVSPERLDRTSHRWEGALPGAVGLLLIGSFALFVMWLNDTLSFQVLRYLLALAGGIGAGLVWGGAWAFANRLFGRNPRLGRHLFILGCGLLALTLYTLGSTVIAYAYSFEALSRYSSHVAILIVAGMIFFHLNTVKPHNSRRFAINCLLLALLGSCLTLLTNQQRTGSLADSPYMAVILQPSLRVSPDHSVDEFIGDVNGMKAQLDKERAEKASDGSEDE